MNNKKYVIAISILAVILIALLLYIFIPTGREQPEDSDSEQQAPNTQVQEENNNSAQEDVLSAIDTAEASDVRVTMADGQSFVIELYPHVAPITVANFLKLVNEKFYDGLTFHRVIDGFVAQGGDPVGNGTGGSKDTIKGEFSENGTENKLSHKRGVVSMARSNDPDSASSQFFICYDDVSSSLDGKYAAFGYVTEGMDVVDSFLKINRDSQGKPDTEIKIEKIEVIQ